MLSEVFILNRKGHLVFRELGQFVTDPDAKNYQLFFTEIRHTPDAPPHFCRSGLHFYHMASDGLHWVAVSARETQVASLQVISWLQSLRDVIRSLLGTVSEASLRTNHLVLRELATEIMEDGLMMPLEASRLRALLLSRPCVTLTSPDLGSPVSPTSPLRQPSPDATKHNIYLDVVETVDCTATVDGQVERCEVTGRVEMRTVGPGCPRVDIALAEDVTVLEPGTPASADLGAQVYLQRLHPSAGRRGRWLTCPPGQVTLAEYSGALSRPQPPVSLRASCRHLPSTTDLHLELGARLITAGAARRRAPSLSLQFRPPGGTSGVCASCGGAGAEVKHDRQQGMVTWTVRGLGDDHEATCQLRLVDAWQTGVETVGPFLLNWEVSDHTVTGLRVSTLNLAGVPESQTARWVRHVTVSSSHTVQPVPVT